MKFSLFGYEITLQIKSLGTMSNVLQPSEYDASYFDGNLQPLRHNAGYSEYKRWFRNEGANSLGEYWKDYATGWVNNLALSGKKLLEVGCAKGFLVQDLNDMGVDAYGIDVSDYAINTALDAARIARPDLASKFFVGDARTALSQFSNKQFDVLLTLRSIECIPEADIPALITEMTRISKTQVHVVDDFTGVKAGAGLYYVQHTAQQWLDLYKWPKGTKIVPMENQTNWLTK